LVACYLAETSGRSVVEAGVNRRSLRYFYWLFHNDIECDDEAENDGKEVEG